MRRALALAVVAMAVAAPAASAQAPDYTLRAKGSKTGLGKVSAIGPFKLAGRPEPGRRHRRVRQPSPA